MNKISIEIGRQLIAILVVLLFIFPVRAQAVIDGIIGTTFNLTAKADFLVAGDGNSILFWGYANGDSLPQYPGPTLIINQGDTITINLKNELPASTGPVSIVFPGQEVTATGGASGLLTREAPPDGTTVVTYTFTATHAGTYLYHSGTRPDLQVEMGLLGAIIVRPTGFDPDNPRAYAHPNTSYDREYLLLLSEMDPGIHEDLALFGQPDQIDTTTFRPNYWFINGRNAPETMVDSGDPLLPNQPYGAMLRMHPGEKIFIRFIGAGRDPHPLHTHGNNILIIARDGRVLESTPGAGPDLAVSDFTLTVLPGATFDAIFEWTGKALGWDIYGHNPGDPLEPDEYAPDHGKPFPVFLPNLLNVNVGDVYSGSPFLGVFGSLPPGVGGFNLNAGFFHMFHSHSENEMTNNDEFPGGMMTMMVIEHPGVPIP
jgi:FtsP/CotA-like multicopper oxidase with cupredoxin domain